jgi:hypothetical protein
MPLLREMEGRGTAGNPHGHRPSCIAHALSCHSAHSSVRNGVEGLVGSIPTRSAKSLLFPFYNAGKVRVSLFSQSVFGKLISHFLFLASSR